MRNRQEVLLSEVPALFADVLRQFGQARLRATGSSMFPAIRPGDALTVRRCTIGDVARGDVVLLREGNRLYAHRVVDLPVVDGATLLVTRGDAHWHNDPARPPSTLLGRVVAIERDGRAGITPNKPSVFERIGGLALSEWTRVRAVVGETLG